MSSIATEVAFEEAAPWLASVDSDAAQALHTTPRTADGAAAVLAAAACAAWLLDMRKMQPLPELSEGISRLLTTEHVRVLSDVLPSEQRRRWRLLFTACRDGTSFTRFVALGMQRTPCLLVIRDKGGCIFGGFASEPPKPSPQFGGGYGSFLFKLAPGAPECATRTHTRWPRVGLAHTPSRQRHRSEHLHAHPRPLPPPSCP